MADAKARIDSPDVIKDFRIQFVKFNAVARQAVDGMNTDSSRITQWLRHDQLSFWTKELKKREELVRQARHAYALAKDQSGPYAKTSSIDEQKDLHKAQRLLEEAEQKLKSVKKWTHMLERELENLAGPVNNLSATLDAATPRALSKLDLLTEKLEDYLRLGPPGT